jgi:hypothetical protein
VFRKYDEAGTVAVMLSRDEEPKRLPVVVTPEEAMAIIEELQRVRWLMGMRCYPGAGNNAGSSLIVPRSLTSGLISILNRPLDHSGVAT